MQIEDLKWEDLKEACTKGLDSTGGIDVWLKKEMALLSDNAYKRLAQWMQSIEDGAEWPCDQRRTRAVFLCKGSTDAGNAMSYRIIKVTSALYRLWGSVRVKNLEDWVRKWQDEKMFAGVPGVGAAEAWYTMALLFEGLRLKGIKVSGGTIDVYKCFDQLLRPLIDELAAKAGMPSKIRAAYIKFIENMIIQMQVGATLGKEHHHRCSIPQGCPFSMMMVALLMRPWIKLMEAHNVEACLAWVTPGQQKS